MKKITIQHTNKLKLDIDRTEITVNMVQNPDACRLL